MLRSVGSPRFAPLALLITAALALAACGEDRKGTVKESGGGTNTTGTSTGEAAAPAKPSGPPVATVEVSETEYSLDPPNPSVAKAGVVRFKVKNAGKIEHALEVEGPSGDVKTKLIKPGASATLEADLGKAGTYEWYCPVDNHKALGIKGEVKVAGGAAGGGSTTEDKPKTEKDSGGGKYSY